MQKRIAVIGGGIAGLGAAWLLRQRYQVALFERNAYVGGHTHTIEVPGPRGTTPVDTGFIVYNEPNYPLLSQLFAWLDVETQTTDMSFAASIDAGRVEYAGTSLQTLFAQRANLLEPGFLRMVRDILRFNAGARRDLHIPNEMTLGEYLALHDFGSGIRDHYLLPMAAAIWSCPVETMLGYPAKSFLRFFANHGLLNLRERPQWRTVRGGSYLYVKAMLRDLRDRVARACTVRGLQRDRRGRWTLHTEAGPISGFDHVVVACHADEAFGLLAPEDRPKRAILRAFPYQQNQAVLHSDPRLMPGRQKVWSSWNYLSENLGEAQRAVCVTYWMNRLQRLSTEQQFFVTLNPYHEPDPATVHARMSYHHPVFDARAMRLQNRLQTLQGQDNLWFCGAYFGYGFHEDALRSAVEVAGGLGVLPPWVTRSAAPAIADVA